MPLADAPVVDVRTPLTRQRDRLLRLLSSLRTEEWGTTTAVPHWPVKDIALHLIDVDLSWLAGHRDHHTLGDISQTSGHSDFVHQLARRNQQWIDGTRVLSPELVTAMLRWSGEQLDFCLSTVDLDQPSSVYWAGDAPVWFDLAREFTERWVHHRQINEAVWPGDPDASSDEYLPLVLSTFVWGYPYQLRADAPIGTTAAVEIDAIGAWTLTRSPTGWTLEPGQATAPAAGLRMTGDAAWRLLTGASFDRSQVRLTGDQSLSEAMLAVRGIIV